MQKQTMQSEQNKNTCAIDGNIRIDNLCRNIW